MRNQEARFWTSAVHTAVFCYVAQKEGYQVRGMDIVPETVEYVRSQGIPCDRARSVGDLDIPENSLGDYYCP